MGCDAVARWSSDVYDTHQNGVLVMADGRTNIVLDTELVEEAQRVTGIQTKREVVDFALRELVQRHRKGELTLLDLAGTVEFEEGYDPKSGWDRPL